jgi:hypothetical protein
VLVRPDMHIAWRANGMADDPAAEPLDVMSRILPAADLTRYSTLLPYISPSGSAISSMRAPSGSRK